MDTNTLFAGIIFGSIGMGYLMYGKKQQNVGRVGCAHHRGTEGNRGEQGGTGGHFPYLS